MILPRKMPLNVTRPMVVDELTWLPLSGCVPALEYVASARGCGQTAVLAAVLHCPGRFGSLTAVAVESEYVRVHPTSERTG